MQEAGLLLIPNRGTTYILQGEIAERLLDRLDDMNKTFKRAAVLGGAGGSVVTRLIRNRKDIQEIHYLDSSNAMLRRVRKVT